MCGHSCNSGGVGGSIRCACICTSQQKQQQLKKQAVWVRMHLQGCRGRGRGRGLETLEISETTTEEEEGGEWLKLGAIKLVTDFDLNQH